MKTLYEIIEDAKSGLKPSHEECYWAMLALDALNSLDAMGLRRIVKGNHKYITPEYILNESFNRTKRALSSDPKIFVGPGNDPSTKEYQHRRKISLKILKTVESLGNE